jgi:hypothetical protein
VTYTIIPGQQGRFTHDECERANRSGALALYAALVDVSFGEVKGILFDKGSLRRINTPANRRVMAANLAKMSESEFEAIPLEHQRFIQAVGGQTTWSYWAKVRERGYFMGKD